MSRLADVKRIQNEVAFVQTLGGLVQTYEEIYVARMQKVRKSVVGTREFTEGLSQIFTELRQHENLLRTEKNGQSGSLHQEAKSGMLVVLLTTSQRWAGDINRDVYTEFSQYVKKHPSAKLMIIGKIGKEFYDQQGGKPGYWYFDIADEVDNLQVMEPILNRMTNYQQIVVFYGKFTSFARQESSKIKLMGEVIKHKASEQMMIKMRTYLFEPSLEMILKFFKTQISQALFKQSMHESYLAQLGSRVMVLEQAVQQIELEEKRLNYQQLKVKRRSLYRQQMQSIVGTQFESSYR